MQGSTVNDEWCMSPAAPLVGNWFNVNDTCRCNEDGSFYVGWWSNIWHTWTNNSSIISIIIMTLLDPASQQDNLIALEI